MNEIYDYHIVTDSSMEKGQHIIFNDVNYSGVYKRVNDKIQIVFIYPEKYNADFFEYHTKVAMRELALEKVRKDLYLEYPSRMSCLYVSNSIEESEK